MTPEEIQQAAQRCECGEQLRRRPLITTVGMSPDTSRIAIASLEPDVAYLVHTSETAESAECIRGDGKTRYESIRVTKGDPHSILEEVHRLVEKEPDAVIDLTGGTKVMSACAMVVALQRGNPLVYVEGDYDPVVRKPRENSTRLREVRDASDFLSWERMAEAAGLADVGSYRRSAEIFEEVSGGHGPFAKKAHFAGRLAALYRDWMSFDPSELKKTLDADGRSIRQSLGALGDGYLSNDAVEAVRWHLDLMQKFSMLRIPDRFGDDTPTAISLVSLLLQADHLMAVQDRREFAALLYYRVLEGALNASVQSRVSSFNSSDVAWSAVNDVVPSAWARCRQLLKAALGERERDDDDEPKRLGLVQCGALALILADGTVAANDAAMRDEMKSIRDVADVRNSLLIVHGSGKADERLKDLRRLAISWTERLSGTRTLVSRHTLGKHLSVDSLEAAWTSALSRRTPPARSSRAGRGSRS